MKTAYVFPGQEVQFGGIGKDLYESNALAKKLFDKEKFVELFAFSYFCK